MKTLARLLLAMLAAAPLLAQSNNPVTDVVRQMVQSRAKNMVTAADEMPADKYGFKPTPAQETFGHMQLHIVEANYELCAATGAAPSADDKGLKDTDPKNKIVPAMQRSFDYCIKALEKMTDANLGDEATFFGRKLTKGAAILYMVGGWGDHYAAQAMYLRLNGLLPPTAQKAPQKAQDKDKKDDKTYKE